MSDSWGTWGYGVGLSQEDLWRLSDSLSVIDAAILITGNNPEEKSADYDDYGDAIGQSQRRDYAGYEAVFKALRAAILSNKLRADVRHSMRGTRYGTDTDYDGVPYEIVQMPHEEQLSYEYLIARQETSDNGRHPLNYGGKTRLNFSVDDIRQDRFFYIHKEPNWEQTLIAVDDLKDWLSERGIHPPFFFPQGKSEGFRDKNHPRYAPKLATAVAAWEAVTTASANASVKQTLATWIQSNGVKYGLGDEKEIVSATAADEVAKIANWNLKGGANPTAVNEDLPKDEKREPIENYKFGYPEYKKDDDSAYDEGGEIPF
ncbi:hypothetical protein [Celeribacter neptunius]|uniref:Uncharacterized protein n=1 Tax=Celeribacter neptunius TaxID=588602 RepID=A0A1I3U0P1_9RHOB|nr:hypothetical protein [Celeribacter neptunius]SFJ75351.1 hypothetical protein SAMN04487991_2919 [Celeribacter neptunius]